MIDLALIGFSLGIIISLLAILGFETAGYLFIGVSALVSLVLILYLVSIEIEVGIICKYCTVMRIMTASSAMLASLWFIKRKEWIG